MINSNARIEMTDQKVAQIKDEINIIIDSEKNEYFKKSIFLNL
jgi:hypothetical protein